MRPRPSSQSAPGCSLQSARFVSAPATSSICPSFSLSISTSRVSRPTWRSPPARLGRFSARFIRASDVLTSPTRGARLVLQQREQRGESLAQDGSWSPCCPTLDSSGSRPPARRHRTWSSPQGRWRSHAILCLMSARARGLISTSRFLLHRRRALESSATSGLIPPACSIATWFSGCWHGVPEREALALAGAEPFSSNSTSGGKAPAATIAAWLVGFWIAKLPRIPAPRPGR